ncbi:MAG: hypothetical protein QXP07_00140 [Candidatus Parvarchaeum sp.]|nr:hypothetical protein [Candidatus Parvarchaeum tengchongense]
MKMKLPFEDPEYSKGRYNTWLMPWIRKRIAHNMDVLALVVGPRGSGKSYSALELAYTCDSTFNQEKVFFDVTEFVDYIIDGKLSKGNAAILDDAGVFMNSRDWRSIQNKAISIVAQSFRYKNLITFITVPKENYIDAQTRGLFNITFEATDEQGVFKVKLPKPNPFRRGEDMLVYPREQVPTKGLRTRTVTVKTTKFHLPPQWLIDQYEAKRDIEIRKKQKEVQEQLHSIGREKNNNGSSKKGRNPNSIKNLKQFRGKKQQGENTESPTERKQVFPEASPETYSH